MTIKNGVPFVNEKAFKTYGLLNSALRTRLVHARSQEPLGVDACPLRGTASSTPPARCWLQGRTIPPEGPLSCKAIVRASLRTETGFAQVQEPPCVSL